MILISVSLTDLPIIRLITSPTPIGLRPGFLSNGISFEASRASTGSLKQFREKHNYLAKAAIDLHKLLLYVPKDDKVKIRFYPSDSKLDGPDAPLTSIYLYIYSKTRLQIVRWNESREASAEIKNNEKTTKER